MTNLKSGKLKRPMKVLDASSMQSIKGGRGKGKGGNGSSSGSGSLPPPEDF